MTLRKDQTLTITYGANGGANGVDVGDSVSDASFDVQSRIPSHDETTDTDFVSIKELIVKVIAVDGSGFRTSFTRCSH